MDPRWQKRFNCESNKSVLPPNIECLIQYHIGRCHPLHHNRKNQFAMDLVHPMRLVFEKRGTDIQIAYIMEIVDYH